MQYALTVFKYENEEHGPQNFRTIIKDGEPWFYLRDVCRELELANPRDAAARLRDNEKGVVTADTLGGPQKVLIVNEPGFYRLVFTSRKPSAERFKDWVVTDVLPTIRKTGSYGNANPYRFMRRAAENWERVAPGYFSVISEMIGRVYSRLEIAGHVVADVAPDGKELRPDVSVGRYFSEWLTDNHPDLKNEARKYPHKTPQTVVMAN